MSGRYSQVEQISSKLLTKCFVALALIAALSHFLLLQPDFNHSFCESPNAPLCLLSGIQSWDSTDLFAISAARQIKHGA